MYIHQIFFLNVGMTVMWSSEVPDSPCWNKDMSCSILELCLLILSYGAVGRLTLQKAIKTVCVASNIR